MTNKGANVHEFVIMKAGTKVEPPFGDKDEGNIYWEIDDVQPGQTKIGQIHGTGPRRLIRSCAARPNISRWGWWGP